MPKFPYIANGPVILHLLTDRVPEDQWIRELAQNSFDAGATEVMFDPVVSDDGRKFTRVSDNGHGMSEVELINRTRAISDPKRIGNFGFGGRISALKVSAQVVWASKLAGQQPFAVEANRSEIDSRPPLPGELSYIAKDHGTSVVFYGDGRSSTWGKIKRRTIVQTLMQRYYTYGKKREGHDVVVRVYDWNKDDNPSDYLRPVLCMQDMLAMYSQHTGAVTLDDGTEILWHVMKEPEGGKEGGLQNLIGGGNICVLDGWELYDYPASKSTRFSHFGIYGDSACRRTFLIVKPAAGLVHPSLSRDHLELVVRKNARAGLPWKDWGLGFATALPTEIIDLLPKADTSSALSEDFKLPLDWYNDGVIVMHVISKAKDAKPAVAGVTRVISKADRSGGPPNPNPTPRPPPNNPPRPRKQEVDSERLVATEDPNGAAKAVPKWVRIPSPSIRIMEDKEWSSEPDVKPYDFQYQEHGRRMDGLPGPVLLVKKSGRAISKQTRNWVRKRKGLPNDNVANIVAQTYAEEISAKIVDFQMNSKASWPTDSVDQVLSPPNLTFAAEGHWAIDLLIEKALKDETMRLITSLDTAAE